MVKNLVHDPLFLSMKSDIATKADLTHAQDLLDTLKAHKDSCVGIAGNMIGVRKKIIAFINDSEYIVMINPEITEKLIPYETEESCLSLLGGPRKCTRYNIIKVKWQSTEFKTKIQTFSGFSAQIIQHEIDHLNGVLI